MAFSFNFDIPLQTTDKCDEEGKVKDENQDHANKSSTIIDAGESVPNKVKEATEHIYTPDALSQIENSVIETVTIGTLPPLHYLNESVFEQTVSERADSENILSQAVTQNSDLISGVYEGGLKIWECTYDLLEYLDDEGETFSGKSVLDLGCGAGLLGILALKRGAGKVHFQDYNSTVIEQFTMPNVVLNTEEESDEEDKEDSNASPPPKRRTLNASPHSLKDHPSFFSGDWTSYLALMQTKDPTFKYDIIFTSETIYNTEYYSPLHSVFHELLAKDGVVYLATKSHYFGVGGGLHLFENFVEEKAVFHMKYLKEVDQGLKRHVVSLSFKKHLS
ncbi:histidine protein methyltransferase 1 homolog [Brachyhypopomus gauderio]|uniref:histidine protein methyltransferase 1 homolog n=1 Tax=Brachyhypopomus gauderio TaxID=698409 RepID=UPI0040436EF6